MTKRKKRLSVLLLTLSLSAGGALWMYGGCAAPPLTGRLRSTEARSQQLMSMAAAEAAEISDIDARLTRQLNLADKQIARGWKDDAKATLTACRETLKSPDAATKLNDHARLSGWVSSSELSRSIEDKDGANVSCDGAVTEVRKLADPAVRCQYVMGISNELQYIKGKDEAAKMLQEAGPWTKSIDNVATRRQAVISFSTALFNLDEYAGGQALLKNEGDASWRSDMLAQLAMQMPADDRQLAQYSAQRKSANMAMEQSAAAPAAALDSSRQSDAPGGRNYFGKDLQYRTVFQNQINSQTGK